MNIILYLSWPKLVNHILFYCMKQHFCKMIFKGLGLIELKFSFRNYLYIELSCIWDLLHYVGLWSQWGANIHICTITLFALNIYMFLAHNKLIGIEKCFQREVYIIDRLMKLYKNCRYVSEHLYINIYHIKHIYLHIYTHTFECLKYSNFRSLVYIFC